MAIFRKKKSKKEQTVAARRKRRDEARPTTVREAIDSSQWLAAGLFVILILAIVLICFVGRSPAGPRLLAGQNARIRVVAEMPFTYESQILTNRLVEQRKRQVGPYYRINPDTYQSFSNKIDLLEKRIEEQLDPEIEGLTPEEQKPIVDTFNQQFQLDTGLALNDEDMELLIERTTPQQRIRFLNEGKLILRDILREGIMKQDQLDNGTGQGFAPREVYGRGTNTRLQSEEEAVRLLRINLAGLDIDTGLSRALFRIFRKGLKPNVEYDEIRTQERIEAAVSKVKPVIITIQPGDVLTEPGERITSEQVEALNAYRLTISKSDRLIWGFNATLAQQTIMVCFLMVSALIYIKLGMPNFRKSNRRMLLTALVLIVNLILIRLITDVGELNLFARNPALQATVAFLAPVAFGGIVTAMLIGARAAVLLSLLIATLFGMMEGNSMDAFLVTLVSSLVGVYYCRDIRLRAKVVRAGAMAGLAVAIGALFFGLLYGFSPQTLFQQVLASLIVGILTGMLAIGVLPLLENLFKYTTDITLLELTDFNHPLLRKLQIEAPGTYHHSLMVANLSERAANEVGANPLLCRATCLFHDIGKMAKPEYFVENQLDGYNPHDERNPTMSALIIKNHVKEGVDMAKEAKLPAVFIDIITEHHGTTLIKFFYSKALNQRQQQTLPLAQGTTASGLTEVGTVDESSFRYDGPRPSTKESAIIFIADSVEAASRSLKKVSPQSVEELVDGIIADRIEDGQLDDAPLTIQEIRKVRDSFVFTLLNMLHSRVEYPKLKKEGKRSGQTPAPIPPSDDKTDTAKPAVV